MSDVAEKTFEDFILPASVVSRIDVSRLVTDLERVDGELTAGSVRAKAGATEKVVPAMSEQLSQFLDQNKLSLDNSTQRSALVKQLRALKDKVPILHMTFAVTADPESLQQLAQWVRTTIHPQAVIDVGLQPALVAGVYLRTPNHVHDLSLRGVLKDHRDVLVKEVEALRGR